MGSLWIARHVDLERDVVIKAIRDGRMDDQSSAKERFKREARAVAMLRSPHIVQIHDFGLDDGVPYIAMELLEGEDLRDRLDRIGAFSLSETADIVSQISEALAVAHQAGLIHRDVKPRNVFLAREGDREIAKLLDFGVAKDTSGLLSSDDTTTGSFLGSPRYMSPEQARGMSVDPRSDVWALGIVTFEMLTGSTPYPQTNVTDVLVQLLTTGPASLGEVAPELPQDVDRLLQRALCHDSADRIHSAPGFAQELAALAARYPDLPAVERAPRSKPKEPTELGRSASTLGDVAAPAAADGDTLHAVGADTTGGGRNSRPHPMIWVGVAAGVLTVGAWGFSQWSGHPGVEREEVPETTEPAASEPAAPAKTRTSDVTAPRDSDPPALPPTAAADAGKPEVRSRPTQAKAPPRKNSPKKSAPARRSVPAEPSRKRDVQTDTRFGVPIGSDGP